MLVPALLSAPAAAADLELEVTVPGADPIRVEVPDVASGTALEIPVHTEQGPDYRLSAEVRRVAPPEVDSGLSPMWQIAFDLAEGRRATTVLHPTMQARENEPATFSSGREFPLVVRIDRTDGGPPTELVTWSFRGVTLRWVIRSPTG